MNVNLGTIAGMESDFEKSKVSTEAGNILTFNNQSVSKTQNAFSVDLNSSLFSNNAYGEGKKTKSDIMTEAQNSEMNVRHNYMSLMANTLSPEDFAKGAEEGFDLSETNADETVTILDKIKATLAQSGKEIVGFNDDLSAVELKKITGNQGLADKIASSFHKNDIPVTEDNTNDVMETIRKMEDVTELSDEALKYMTLNDLEPTMDNLYMAKHATNGQGSRGRGFIALETEGYYAKKADFLDFEGIRDQANKIIEEAGLEVNEDNTGKAKWMIEQSIPLTRENLSKIHELSQIELPLNEDDVIEAAARAIADKKPAASGKAEDSENNLQKAAYIFDHTKVITNADVDRLIRGNIEYNLKNLFAVHDENMENVPVIQEEAAGNTDQELLTARMQLEEVRLKMSISTNLRLIDKGIEIDTEPISKLIGELNAQIEEIGKSLFPEAAENASSKYMLFEETTAKVQEFTTYPLGIIGKLEPDEKKDLGSIIESGYQLKLRYEKAGATYEAVGTAPRADLGDNIRKAFRNVTDILKDLGQEVNEENKRVVRILGYNRMEINEENIEKVRTVDEKLMNVLEKLKPSAVLNMIRNDQNPLKMTIDELSQNLSDGDKDSSKREEKYAKFLYKLEKNAEITPEEKESYIGIYRLFHQLKKTDNAAIGAVLETGAEMTIGNLLSASRTLKKKTKGMDVKIDDSLLSVEAKETTVKTIDSQIETAFRYYSEKADVVYDNLEPEKLSMAKPEEDTLLDELADKLREAAEQLSQEIENQYYSEQTKQTRQIIERSDAGAAEDDLKKFGIEISAANLQAIMSLRSGRRGRNSIFDQVERIAHLAFKETEKEMVDELTDADDYKSSYKDHLMELSYELDEILTEDDGPDSYIDVKAIHLMQKQISVATKMADRGSFEIPVEVDGRRVSMHVTLREDETQGSKLEASLETVYYGRISMAMTVEEGEVKGIFSSSLQKNQEIQEYMEDVRDKFIYELQNSEPELDASAQNIGIMYRQTDPGSAIQGAENGFSDSRLLLRMAGIFVHAV